MNEVVTGALIGAWFALIIVLLWDQRQQKKRSNHE